MEEWSGSRNKSTPQVAHTIVRNHPSHGISNAETESGRRGLPTARNHHRHGLLNTEPGWRFRLPPAQAAQAPPPPLLLPQPFGLRHRLHILPVLVLLRQRRRWSQHAVPPCLLPSPTPRDEEEQEELVALAERRGRVPRLFFPLGHHGRGGSSRCNKPLTSSTGRARQRRGGDDGAAAAVISAATSDADHPAATATAATA